MNDEASDCWSVTHLTGCQLKKPSSAVVLVMSQVFLTMFLTFNHLKKACFTIICTTLVDNRFPFTVCNTQPFTYVCRCVLHVRICGSSGWWTCGFHIFLSSPPVICHGPVSSDKSVKKNQVMRLPQRKWWKEDVSSTQLLLRPLHVEKCTLCREINKNQVSNQVIIADS